MTKQERVKNTINHKETDRVPRGELAIEKQIRDALLGESGQQLSDMAKELAVREKLGMDLINVHEFPMKLKRYDRDGFPIYHSVLGDCFKDNGHSTQLIHPAIEDIEDYETYEIPDIGWATTHQLDYYKENSDLFVFTQVNGPVSSVNWALGMEDYMCYCMTDIEAIEYITEQMVEFEIQRAKLFIDHHTDAIMMTDDIGFNTGALLPPHIMDRVAYPFYKRFIEQIKAYKDIPVFLHTDGYIYEEIPKIIEVGFDGLHSLQPSAGMDIYKIKEQYGDKLCLMGNIDLDYLMPFGTQEEVESEVGKLIENIGNQGGFILSTCNILTDSVKLENAKAMYRSGMRE